ncbi:MAG: aminotransferase class I/II-fold pyridoxal phosphate-dependent enzyme [Candidatus Eisenbacteria bacterium]|nr:aminotransferase class I/II-fold pyridoxal phosphate-dependent enzyme [Candidatus Eisenbacteria bacterium]
MTEPTTIPGAATDLPVSAMANGLVGSEILKIAADIRARIAAGEAVVNLTVGDFKPSVFSIPGVLKQGIAEAYDKGETNYPPSDGVPELRQAVRNFYAERLGLDYSTASVVIAGGVRPVIYCAYRTLLDPGETLAYPVPSWNNNHYAWLVGARGQPIIARRETNFLPTAGDLKPHLAGTRVLILNSPLNPAGTAFTEDELRKIVEMILDENGRRAAAGQRPLMLLYDQVYWMLTFGTTTHITPVAIDPRMRDYTLFTDGMSKAFAATGLRVGWCVGPEKVMKPFSDILGHVGAWAPRPEQIACARFLADSANLEAYSLCLKHGIEKRLVTLHEGFEAMRNDGYPVESIAPQGAIYLSARIDLIGKTLAGTRLDTNEQIRQFLLKKAAMAIVPFQAFGLKEESGWFRLSVGALAPTDLDGLFPRLREVLGEARG